MELSPKAMETLNQALAKQIKEAYRALSTQFQQQLEQFSNKCEERFKNTDKHKRKGVRSTFPSDIPKPRELSKSDFIPQLYEPEVSTFKLDCEEALARIKSKSKPVTATVKEEEEVSHNLYLSHSEFNELYEPEMTTFKFDYEDTLASTKSTCHKTSLHEPEMSTFTFEDTLTSLKAKCDISSMQSDFVLDTLTSKEPVQPSSMILVPQVLERKSAEGAQRSLPLIINLENKRCKPPDRERNQLPSFSSFIFPKEEPPDEASQRIYDTQVSLSSEFIYYWNNYTYARIIKQPVLNIESSRIIDLIFSISAKEDTGSLDVYKGLTRTGTIWRLKVEPRERTKSVLMSVTPSSTPHPSISMSSENPKHFNQVSDSFPRFVSHELKSRNMSLFYPGIIEKKLGLFVGKLRQNSYLYMLEKELDDKNNYLDVNEIPLFVYRDSMTVIMHLLFAKGAAYFAGVKEEPPDLKVLSFTFFPRTGIGVDLTKGKTDLRTNLFEEGEDDVSTASQKREVSSEPELGGRIELRRCLKQFIRLFAAGLLKLPSIKSSTSPFWRLHQVMITK